MFTSHTWVVAITVDSTERDVFVIGNILSDSTVLGEKGQTGQLLSKQGRDPSGLCEGPAAGVGALGGGQARVATAGGAGEEAVRAPGTYLGPAPWGF